MSAIGGVQVAMQGAMHKAIDRAIEGTLPRFPSVNVGQVLQRHPFASQLVMSVANLVSADLLVQTCIERRDRVDWKRTSSFASLAVVYSGGIQYFMCVKVFKNLFPEATKITQQSFSQMLRNTKGLSDTAKQVAVKNFFLSPFVYFPTFYFFKELAHQKEGTTFSQTARTAISKYREEMVAQNKALLKFWIPADCVIFLLPLWLRLPMIHASSFVWTSILSARSGAKHKPLASTLRSTSEDVCVLHPKLRIQKSMTPKTVIPWTTATSTAALEAAFLAAQCRFLRTPEVMTF
uniref:Uncharacterized protein n=1 Tax=Eutreptiella gymnastica TaxID=73025 RepID=A0A7S1IG68_9EUGL|mmetsp:Transcript_16277/g.28888  ORF Transcript_16277/g.28888 Transcript_16277/m.28888 type:complete len:292 (+) Transcript_16277:46-921(+)